MAAGSLPTAEPRCINRTIAIALAGGSGGTLVGGADVDGSGGVGVPDRPPARRPAAERSRACLVGALPACSKLPTERMTASPAAIDRAEEVHMHVTAASARFLGHASDRVVPGTGAGRNEGKNGTLETPAAAPAAGSECERRGQADVDAEAVAAGVAAAGHAMPDAAVVASNALPVTSIAAAALADGGGVAAATVEGAAAPSPVVSPASASPPVPTAGVAPVALVPFALQPLSSPPPASPTTTPAAAASHGRWSAAGSVRHHRASSLLTLLRSTGAEGAVKPPVFAASAADAATRLYADA